MHLRSSGSSDSLRDLGMVGFEIESLPQVLGEEGVTREELFTVVRERLERRPVQVVTRTGALHLSGAPTLFLEVWLAEPAAGSCLYSVALEFVQGVSLERLSDKKRVFAAPTWRAQVIGCAAKRERSALLDPIALVADAFANAGSR